MENWQGLLAATTFLEVMVLILSEWMHLTQLSLGGPIALLTVLSTVLCAEIESKFC